MTKKEREIKQQDILDLVADLLVTANDLNDKDVDLKPIELKIRKIFDIK